MAKVEGSPAVRHESYDVGNSIDALPSALRSWKFQLPTLVERYREMLAGGYIGMSRTLRANLLFVIAAVFGDDVASELEEHLT